MRAEVAGRSNPASIDDIYSVLVEGGFNFPSNDPEKQKQGLAVSLGKNTIAFRKLPSGLFGLAEWYGGGARSARRSKRHIDLDSVADDLGSNTDANLDDHDPDVDEAAESPVSDNSAASGPTPYGADEDGREVEHDNMNL